MELVASEVRDVAVMRRLLFATAYLPKEVPNYWEIITSFACQGSSVSLDPKAVEVMMGNLQLLNEKAFNTNASLAHELIDMEPCADKKPLGVILISPKESVFRVEGNYCSEQTDLADSPCIH